MHCVCRAARCCVSSPACKPLCQAARAFATLLSIKQHFIMLAVGAALPASIVGAAPISRVCGSLFVLRDHERCVVPGICGNKARKLAALIDAGSLPRRLVSHGGAQSNAMLALATLAQHSPQTTLRYHTKPLPEWLRAAPSGNLGRALRLGMELVEHGSAAEYEEAVAREAAGSGGDGTLFVPRGAAWPGAEPGVAALAREVLEWRDSRGGAELDVVVAAGTGTTALFLARHLSPHGCRVHAVPCVGDARYLARQMEQLDEASGAVGLLPHTLCPPAAAAVPFGTPAAALLRSWTEAAAAGVFLDLVYGPVAWAAMDARGWCAAAAAAGPRGAGREVLYVNSGGHEGLDTALRRYGRAGLLPPGVDAATALATARASASRAPKESEKM